MSNLYDVGIIGGGPAGIFAARKIAKENKNVKTVVFDLGRPHGKRRRQLEGFFGVFPNSDGKLYLNDINKVSKLTGTRKAKAAATAVFNTLNNVVELKTHKDKPLYINLEKRLKKHGFDYHLNDYIQLYPRDIHAISKNIADDIEHCGNVNFSFDNEVYKIHKQKSTFLIQTQDGEYNVKKLLIAVGRSGWRWASEIYKTFGIIDSNDTATYGIHIEISASYLKDFNKSNVTISNGELEIGPVSWSGTIIPEDHLDLAISAFRSNENRWKTDKASFQFIGFRKFDGNGFEQTNRLGKLAFVLANDRILKERVSTLLSNKSKISVIPEYNWLAGALTQFGHVVPEILTKGYFHIPTILPMPPKVLIGNTLSTEIDDMYVAGESAGVVGLLAASVMGTVAAEAMLK
jgi:hypothetical protein